MQQLRALAEDGLELLGEIDLGGRVAVGDPGRFASPEGVVAVAVVPGRWMLLGRAWDHDPDELAELVLVHSSALADFYALYDGLVSAGAAALVGGRVAVLDSALAGDPDVLKSLYEPDELPWVLAAGVVAGEGPGGPARVFRSGEEPAIMLMVALGPEPLQRAAAPGLVMDDEAR